MSIEWKNQRGHQGARVAWHQLTFFGCNIIVCRFCESHQRAVYLIQKKKKYNCTYSVLQSQVYNRCKLSDLVFYSALNWNIIRKTESVVFFGR
jgi:hypothetical protein